MSNIDKDNQSKIEEAKQRIFTQISFFDEMTADQPQVSDTADTADTADITDTVDTAPPSESHATPLHIALLTATPTRETTSRGETYFAQKLQLAIATQGHTCELFYVSEWLQVTDQDIVIVLRGLYRFTPIHNKFNVMWIINNPDKIYPDELNEYNLIFCASKTFADQLTSLTQTPVFYLPLATDDQYLKYTTDTEKICDLLFVGNNHKYSQNTFRNIIKILMATENEYDLKVVGKHWEPFIDKKYIYAEHIDYEKLPWLYSQARIILNDHHEQLAENGFINNRTYDLAALGQFQISDYVFGIENLGIVTYTSIEDLIGKIDYYLKNPAERDRVTKINKALVAKHMFSKIAPELMEIITSRFMPQIYHRTKTDKPTALSQKLQENSLQTIFSQFDWTDPAQALVQSYLEIALSYVIEKDEKNALLFYSMAFSIYDIPKAEITARFVIKNLKNILPEDQTIQHIKAIEKNLPSIQTRQAQPLVSVIIPTYNRSDLLKNAIESVLTQDYKNMEIIIVNDAGDDVSTVVSSFSDPRLQYISHPENKGCSATRNTGIQNAKGKYIAYLDDDDIYYPNHISTLVEYLERHNAHIAYTDTYKREECVENGEIKVVRKEIENSQDYDQIALYTENLAPLLCVMHKKKCLIKSGLFDEYLNRDESWDLLLRLSAHYTFAHIPSPTSEYRWSSAIDSHQIPLYWSRLNIYYKYIERVREIPAIYEIYQKSIQESFKEIDDYIHTDQHAIFSQIPIKTLPELIERLTFLRDKYPLLTEQFTSLIAFLQSHHKSTQKRPDKFNEQSIAVCISTPCKNAIPDGDTCFADSLIEALIAIGYDSQLFYKDEWDSIQRQDIVLVLWGTSGYHPQKSKLNILWIISNPKSIFPEELDKYDIVLCASKIFAERIRLWTHTPVWYIPVGSPFVASAPLMSTTPKTIDLLFVGDNYKHQFHSVPKIVKHLLTLNKGYDFRVIGDNWESYLEPKYILETSVDPHKLLEYYATAKINLNDHDDDLQDFGFINHKTYDIAAIGQFQISDHLVGISDLDIITYKDINDLSEKIDYYLQHETERDTLAQQNHQKVADFTFTNIAQQIIDVICTVTDHKKNNIPLNNNVPHTLQPFISICIPTYNRGQFLYECINSACEQTYSHYEIVIVDDGSTDDTEKIVSTLIATAPHKIRYHKKEHTNGSDTRNVCIEQAKGDFILWLDSDDILVADILTVYVDFVNLYPDVDVFYGNLRLIGDYFSYGKDEIVYQDNYQMNHDLISRFLSKNRLPNGGALIRREVFEKYGGYNTTLNKAVDYELWSRIIDKVSFKHITTTSYFWRWHESNVSTHTAKKDFTSEAKILTAMLERFTLRQLFPYIYWGAENSALILVYLEIAKTYARWDDSEMSLYYYQKAFARAGRQIADIDLTKVIHLLRSLFGNETIVKEHTDALAKFFPEGDLLSVHDIYNHREYLDYMLQNIRTKKQKKKILFVLHDFPPYKLAGIQIYALNIAKRLNTSPDIQIDIFHPVFLQGPADYSIEKTVVEGLDVYVLYKPVDEEFSWDKVKNYQVGVVFTRFLQTHHYELIHFHSLGQLSIIVAEIAQQLGITTYFTIHDNWMVCYLWHRVSADAQVCHETTSSETCSQCLLRHYNARPEEYHYVKMMLEFRNHAFRSVFTRFDRVFAVSEYIKNILAQFAPRKITVNHIGFVDLGYEKEFVKKETIVFGFMGQIAPHKGVHLLVSAFTRLECENAELRIYGLTKHVQYMDFLRSATQSDSRIKFYGQYSPADLQHIIPEIDVMVVPSLIECFPLVILEAFQYQTPVIASSTGGIPELVTEGQNGLLFENNNPDELYTNLKYIVDNPTVIPILAQGCRIRKTLADDVSWHYAQYIGDDGNIPAPLGDDGNIPAPLGDDGNHRTSVRDNGDIPVLDSTPSMPSTQKKRVMVYYFKNVHIPILKPITDALIQRDDITLAIGYMQFAPEIRAGFLPSELQIIKAYNLPMYITPQTFRPDVTIIADSVYPWVENCGKLIHVGHGVLSKGQYYTDTDTARREELADIVCVPGVYHQQALQKVISKPVIATGMPKLDALFSRQITRESELTRLQLPQKYFYVLFAPTFNDELSAIPYVTDSIHEVLPTPNSFLLIKLHPSTDVKHKEMYRQLHLKDSRVVYIDELDITPYLAIADVIISDVSSAMMEFAALEKPVVVFNNPLRSTYKNFNPSDLEYTHRDIGYQVNDLQEMKVAILKVYRGKDICHEKRKTVGDLLFANKYDGKATQRVVEIILSDMVTFGDQ